MVYLVTYAKSVDVVYAVTPPDFSSFHAHNFLVHTCTRVHCDLSLVQNEKCGECLIYLGSCI